MTPMLSTQALTATAGVIARPPLLYLGALALGLIVDHLWPLPFKISRPGLAHDVSAAFACFMLLVGVALMGAGIRGFVRANTPVPTVKPTRVLVTTGIHARTRNPIYVGMFVIYAGIALLVRSPWALVLIAPLALVVRYGVVAREEAYLEQRFGDAYREYKARVRRWL
jgi:protein-S-isoprenylcysteine O-methyltransferase Ste14